MSAPATTIVPTTPVHQRISQLQTPPNAPTRVDYEIRGLTDGASVIRRLNFDGPQQGTPQQRIQHPPAFGTYSSTR
jgi:hypothetical protein